MHTTSRLLLALSTYGLACSPCALAAPEDDTLPRLYSSPEERRDAGTGHALTDWLTVSGLLEFESINARTSNHNDSIDVASEDGQTLQVHVGLTPAEWFDAQFIVEYEAHIDHARLDEGMLNFEAGDWGLSLGRLYVPFGEFHSNFASGPLLEFAETRADSVIVKYAVDEQLEVFGYALRGQVGSEYGNRRARDWGMGIEYTSPEENFDLVTGYLSDLAESDGELLEDELRYHRRAAAIATYLRLLVSPVEITAEWIGAIGRLDTVDGDSLRPSAANLEIAWSPVRDWVIAARAEHSHDLADEPARQYGLSVSWRMTRAMSLSIDALHGRYADNFAFDDEDNELRRRTMFSALLAIEL